MFKTGTFFIIDEVPKLHNWFPLVKVHYNEYKYF